MTNKDLLRHLLATLAYRFAKQVKDSQPTFGDFEAGSGVKTPRDLVRYLTQLLLYLEKFLDERISIEPLSSLDWQAEIDRFFAAATQLDEMMQTAAIIDDAVMLKILQGPLADALTHVGQLATLRRLSGYPVYSENYMQADIQIGRVGPEQTKPGRTFG